MIRIPSELHRSPFKDTLIVSCLLFVLQCCGSGDNTFNKSESGKIDSLITVSELNDRAIHVKFGYEAVTALNTEKGIVVIDAGISTGITEKYKNIIIDKFRSDNIIYIINTHGHHDHCRGNSVFSKSSVVGHINCREELSEWQKNPDRIVSGFQSLVEDYDLQLMKASPGTVEWDDLFTQKIRCFGAYNDASKNVPLKMPVVTFSDSLKIDCGNALFEMIYFGECHSTSDILIYVPQAKLLFTGDLFTQYGRLSISNTTRTDKSKWKQARLWIEKRSAGIEKVIGGHGQILPVSVLNNFIQDVQDD